MNTNKILNNDTNLNNQIKLCGTIERITYFNEEQNYCVAKLRCENQKDLITITGTFASINVGEYVELIGEWQKHKDYGVQFKVSQYLVKLPNTILGIKKYLGSGLIKGIGPKMAERITNHFKEKTIEVIDKTPRALLEIEGIGEWRLEQIIESWKSQNTIREIMMFLQKYDISLSIAAKIYKQYGENAIKILTENPYRLANDIYGVGFKSADKIALSMNIPEDSEIRIRAGIIYCLNQQTNDGHVFTFKSKLFEELKKFIDISLERFNEIINKMVVDEEIIVEDETKVFLKPLFISELKIAHFLKEIIKTPFNKVIFETDEIIKQVEKSSKVKYAPLQLHAINTALSSKIMVLTGGPGTGKTTTIRGIIKAFKMLGCKILQCAPTGRASKKMEESTGEPSKTIHRLLEYSPIHKKFLKDTNNPLDCDVLICDEVSMIDIILMYQLIKAIPKSAKLILIGDVNQLPSVGPGNVLKDIINSNVIPVVELNQIFRQDESSLIILNAHKINNGEMPIIPKKNDNIPSDFYFIEKDDPKQALEMIVKITTDRIPNRFGLNPIDDIQILCPMYRGDCGVTTLNSVLQKTLNKSNVELFHRSRIFKVGDKVIQIENDYKKNVFNGDIGKIVDIRTYERIVVVDFLHSQVEYEYNDLDSLELAYAITIHKSQGSEYKAVVIPILTSHYIMLKRNLIYTAVTRAKTLVVIVGSKKAMYIALSNNRILERNSTLANKLQLEVNK